jgi:hypothetical protein
MKKYFFTKLLGELLSVITETARKLKFASA